MFVGTISSCDRLLGKVMLMASDDGADGEHLAGHYKSSTVRDGLWLGSNCYIIYTFPLYCPNIYFGKTCGVTELNFLESGREMSLTLWLPMMPEVHATALFQLFNPLKPNSKLFSDCSEINGRGE